MGSRVIAAIRGRGAWFVSASAMLWFGPAFVLIGVGEPKWLDLDASAEKWLRLGALLAMTLAALISSELVPSLRRREWRLSPIPVFAAFAGFLGLCESPAEVARWLRSPGDFRFMVSACVVLALLVALSHTLGRRNLDDLDPETSVEALTRRLVPSALVLWLLGVQLGRMQGFSWNCFGTAASAEWAAHFSAGGYAVRIFCSVSASTCVLVAVASTLRRRPTRAVLPLLGVGVWLGSRAVLDVISRFVARGTFDETLGVDAIAALALFADVAGSVGALLLFACWVWDLDRVIGPLLPVLLVASSPLLEPSPYGTFPQQSPDDLWTRVDGLSPLAGPRVDRVVAYSDCPGCLRGVLDHQGELHLFYFGGRRPVSEEDARAVERHAVSIVVDQNATLGGLRRAARTLRRFDEIVVAWRINPLHQTSVRARERWPFLELSSRALRGRRVSVIREGRIDHEVPSAREVMGRDDARIGDWVDTTSSDERWRVTVPCADPERRRIEVTGLVADRADAEPSVLNGDFELCIWILLLAMVCGLGGVVREFAVAHRVRTRSASRTAGRRVFPFWVRESKAELRIDSRGAPYRDLDVVFVASTTTAMLELVARAAPIVRAISIWLSMAVLATVVGFLILVALSAL